MQFVEDTLKKSPGMGLEELFEKAKEVSASIGELDKRQFNARYPLQVKRRAALASRPRAKAGRRTAGSRGKGARRASTGKTKSPSDASRDSVRNVLLQFAMDIAGAQERKDLVKVLANVDRYVDRVLKDLT